MRNRHAERELVEKLEALANDAARGARGARDRALSDPTGFDAGEAERLEERATNYAHAATLARGVLDVR